MQQTREKPTNKYVDWYGKFLTRKMALGFILGLALGIPAGINTERAYYGPHTWIFSLIGFGALFICMAVVAIKGKH